MSSFILLKGTLRSKERAGLTENLRRASGKAEPLKPTLPKALFGFTEGPAMTSGLLAPPPSRLPPSTSALYLLLRRAWLSGVLPRWGTRPWAPGKVQAVRWLCGRMGWSHWPCPSEDGRPHCASEPFKASPGTCPQSEGKGLGGQLGDLGSGLSSAPNQPCAWSTSWLSLRPHFLNHTNTGTLRWPRSSSAQKAWQGMVLSSQKVMAPGARPLGVGVPAL